MVDPIPFELVSESRIREEMKRAFLEAYAATALVRAASEAVGIPQGTLYGWRASDPMFAEAWDKVTHTLILPQLEQAAIERAMDKSDLLLMFLMKAYSRKMYDDRQAVPQGDNKVRLVLEVVGKDKNGPETITVTGASEIGKLS